MFFTLDVCVFFLVPIHSRVRVRERKREDPVAGKGFLLSGIRKSERGIH